jgi:hypothetical protein
MYAHLNDDESETNEKAGLKQPSGPGKYVNPMARVGASAISGSKMNASSCRQ